MISNDHDSVAHHPARIDVDNRILASALSYASKGWHVFPVNGIVNGKCTCHKRICDNPGKHPATENGLRDATTDTETIEKWFSGNRNLNIGIATGLVSGFFVLDIDVRDEKDGMATLDILESRYGKLPDTVEAISGSGSSHKYFRMPDNGQDVRNSTSKIGHIKAEGLDIRGTGGYIIAAPSTHISGNSYEWEASSDPEEGFEIADSPKWLLDLVSSSPRVKHEFVSSDEVVTTLTEHEEIEIREALKFLDADNYDTWLKTGMSLHSTRAGEQAYNIWKEWSQQSTKFNERHQIKTWNHFHIGEDIRLLESLFWDARQFGYDGSFDGSIPDLEEIAPFTIQKKEERVIPIFPEKHFDDSYLKPPGIMGDIVDYIIETAPRPQPMFAVATAIALAGTVLGRIYETPTGLRTNFYILSVGSSGSGKEHPRRCLVDMLSAASLESLIGGEEISSASALNSMLYRNPVQVCQIDEFGIWLSQANAAGKGSHAYSLLRRLMTIFTSANTLLPGQELSTNHLKNPDEMKRRDVYCPNLSIHMSTTLIKLAPALTSADVYSGFLNRMLLLHSADTRPRLRKNITRKPVPENIVEWIKKVRDVSIPEIGNLVGSGLENTPCVKIYPDERAQERMDWFLDFSEDKQDELLEAGTDALWSRAVEHAWKLALLAAMSEDPDGMQIKENHVEWAIAFVRQSIDSMQKLADEYIADSDFASVVKQVKIFLKKCDSSEQSEGVTKRTIAAHVPSFNALRPREQTEVIASLEMLGMERRSISASRIVGYVWPD